MSSNRINRAISLKDADTRGLVRMEEEKKAELKPFVVFGNNFVYLANGTKVPVGSNVENTLAESCSFVMDSAVEEANENLCVKSFGTIPYDLSISTYVNTAVNSYMIAIKNIYCVFVNNVNSLLIATHDDTKDSHEYSANTRFVEANLDLISDHPSMKYLFDAIGHMINARSDIRLTYLADGGMFECSAIAFANHIGESIYACTKGQLAEFFAGIGAPTETIQKIYLVIETLFANAMQNIISETACFICNFQNIGVALPSVNNISQFYGLE